MDNLLGDLNSLNVSSHANNPNAEHPHYSLYKSKTSRASQEERRRTILDARRNDRYDLLSHLRNIEENTYINSEENEYEDMDTKECYKRPKEYCNFVMLSEWLVDVPEDFEKEYLAVLCPVGKRCLCVCSKGRTSIYAKNGRRIRHFISCLPGGSRNTTRQGYTVLDCIFSEVANTYYILDIVCWAKQSYINCDTSFRLSWLTSRIDELDQDVSQISPSNSSSFVVAPSFECTKESLRSMFQNKFLDSVALDGVLFYHKDSHYTHGPSPLVCWLKPFMLQEILSVEVPAKFMEERPSHYKNISSHIEEYNEERKQIYLKKSPKSAKQKMEVAE